jgi:hypothetical protein
VGDRRGDRPVTHYEDTRYMGFVLRIRWDGVTVMKGGTILAVLRSMSSARQFCKDHRRLYQWPALDEPPLAPLVGGSSSAAAATTGVAPGGAALKTKRRG